MSAQNRRLVDPAGLTTGLMDAAGREPGHGSEVISVAGKYTRHVFVPDLQIGPLTKYYRNGISISTIISLAGSAAVWAIFLPLVYRQAQNDFSTEEKTAHIWASHLIAIFALPLPSAILGTLLSGSRCAIPTDSDGNAIKVWDPNRRCASSAVGNAVLNFAVSFTANCVSSFATFGLLCIAENPLYVSIGLPPALFLLLILGGNMPTITASCPSVYGVFNKCCPSIFSGSLEANQTISEGHMAPTSPSDTAPTSPSAPGLGARPGSEQV